VSWVSIATKRWNGTTNWTADNLNSQSAILTSTATDPFITDGAVHHWGENRLLPNQTVNYPQDFLPQILVRDTQAEEL
jgi:hypothetical protein